MQPEASDSPATRPKASHCRRERRAVTSRSLPPECPAWVSPSAHPEMSCRPGAALQRTSARVLQRSPRHMPRCRHSPGLLALPRSRLLASARRLSRVWPARGRGGITTRAGTYPMATRGCPCAASDSTRQRAAASGAPGGCAASEIRRIGGSERHAGPTVGMLVRGQLATSSKPASSKKHAGRASPLDAPSGAHLAGYSRRHLRRTNPLQNSRLKTCFQKRNGLSICSCAPYYWDNSQPRQLLASGVCPMISRAARCRTGERGS